MAENKKFPSLPPNYVSILQLQERWNKEKQRRQQKEEEEEIEHQRRRREEEEEEEKRRLKHDRDDRKNKQHGEKCEAPNPHSVVAIPPPRINRTPYIRRNRVATSRRKPEEVDVAKAVAEVEVKAGAMVAVETGGVICDEEEAEVKVVAEVVARTGTMVVAEAGGEEVRDEERKTTDAGSNKKKRRDSRKMKKMKGKSKQVEDVTGEIESGREVVENEYIPAGRNRERKGKLREWRSKKSEYAASGTVSEAKAIDPTVQIEQKFGDLSVNRRKGEGRESGRSRFESNGGGGRRMASRRFGGVWGGGIRMPSDGSLVWVKKEEVCDGNELMMLKSCPQDDLH